MLQGSELPCFSDIVNLSVVFNSIRLRKFPSLSKQEGSLTAATGRSFKQNWAEILESWPKSSWNAGSWHLREHNIRPEPTCFPSFRPGIESSSK